MRLLVSWLMLIDAVISIQKWKEQPHSIEAYEGKDTLLTCKVYNKVRAILRNRKIFIKIARLANVFGGRITDWFIFILVNMSGLEIPEVETAVLL